MLAAAGLAVLWVNRIDPDESRVLGAVLVFVGGAGLLLRSQVVGRIVEAVAVLVLVLLGAEGMLRRENAIAAKAYDERTMHFVADPLLRYEFQPSLACNKSVTNSLGMLGPLRSQEKPPGTLRVACLGDSVGGDCSLPQENACAALESILRERRGGKPVEVLNFSVPGYNTLQEARALELKALPFSPDVVVVLYVVNDPYPDLAVSHFLPGHFKFEHLLAGGARMAAARIAPFDVDPFGGLFEQLHKDPRSWNGVVVAGFDRIRAVADERHLPVVVAVFPLFLERTSPETRAIYVKVAREAVAHGFIGIDLSQTAYKGMPTAALLKPSRDSIHPNALAHHLAATAIADALLAQHPELAR
jgi:lysophospholipase L1-like esterase